MAPASIPLAGAAVALGLLVHAPGLAAAQGTAIDEGRRLYMEADFRASAERFERALDHPDLGRDEALEAHRYLATLSHYLDEPEAAQRHAEAASALDPSVSPPEGSPSAVSDLFERVGQTAGHRASALQVTSDEAATGTRVRATLEPAPEALASTIRLRCTHEGGPPRERQGSPPEVTLEVPRAQGPVRCHAVARTAAGAIMLETRAELSSEPDPLNAAAAATAPGDEEERDGPGAWPWIVTGSAVAVIGAVVAGVLLTRGDGGNVSFDDTMVEGW